MKKIYLILISIASLYSAELIHVSNSTDENSLKHLTQTYKRSIIINDNRAYILPEACLVVRHFGGLSQNSLNLPKSYLHTAPIVVTLEVFQAKDVQEIEEQINKQKSIDMLEGKKAEAFLADSEGHLYDGLSENPLDLTKQKIIITQTIDSRVNPTCKLLDDGSGYQLYNTTQVKRYINDSFEPILSNIVLFN